MIKAITFDFWDTLVKDDSDEPKRTAQGLARKSETRLQLLTTEITRHHPEIKPKRVQEAFDHTNARFRHHWKVEHFTPPVASRLQEAYTFLKIDLTPGFNDVVREIEEMEVKIPPDFVPGVHEALATLAEDYKLGLISDAIHTPGWGLRQILKIEGLLQYFSHWVFSDEAGASKPAPVVFEQASAGLDVPLTQIVHVGDRESNDIAGPLAVGMPAILYTGVVDRGSANTQATAICQDYAELPGIIKQLEIGD
jgi:putative hydrolase of the HAD superfamily